MAVNEGWRLAVLAVVGFGLAICAMVAMPSRLRQRLTVTNHRGRPVPATLGVAVFAASVLAQAIAGAAALFGGTELGHDTWALMAGATLVFAAGILDDLRPGGPRGLIAHGRALLHGRATIGLLKAVADVVGAVLVVLTVHGRSFWVMAAGVVLIAGAANVWNGLDVAPGRAGKAFVLASVPMLFLAPPSLLARLLGAEVAAIWPDLRERGMLGDSGSNLVGFVAGAAAYSELTGIWVAVAAGVAVALNVLAETLTLSRCIQAVAPLRWLDRAGRLSDETPDATVTETSAAGEEEPEPPAEPSAEDDPEPAGRR